MRSSLSSIPDVIKATPFNQDVHHRGFWPKQLLAEAALGGLKPPPTGRLRRAFLHLSHSTTLARLLDTTLPRRVIEMIVLCFHHGLLEGSWRFPKETP